MASKTCNIRRASNILKNDHSQIEDIIIDNDEDEQLLYNVKNIKIFSIDQSDKYAMRYDLLTKTGELKLFLNKNNKLKLSLNEVKNLSDGYTCREFLDISFDSIKFNELRIKNNKLTIKNKLIIKNAYCFETNSTNLQELIDIHQSLMTFKEIYYPELSVKEEIKPNNKTENSNVAAFLANNNQQEQKAKKRKMDEKEVINICDALIKAIKTGNLEDSAKNAKMLAEFELDISIKFNHNNSDFKKVEIIDDLFSAYCVVIRENEKQNKNIFLENLNLNMKISDLKQKVFSHIWQIKP
jgi:hypothetical protein